ncbi:MAG: hypothetical protein LBR82_10275 [Desulfovibrio sp.]|jgi:hypothetical protein|nr:hypothetical protein [Desulfovibrio sp.]
MVQDWNCLFTAAEPGYNDAGAFAAPLRLPTLDALRHFLDLVHIKYCLAKPFFELPDYYPVVEPRELLPSFEADPWEYAKLPAFSLVAFDRPVRSFMEIFQFDRLIPPDAKLRADLARENMDANLSVFLSRLPRAMQEILRRRFANADVADLAAYPALMPYLACMDRGQVMGLHGPHPRDMNFYLAGVYASFPSDLDTEVKRYGVRIGKFRMDDHDTYEQNRNFVLQHLMELYGFPVSSERRTSAAVFARRLHRMGERFLIRVLGQSDRTLTTIYGPGTSVPYPYVDKIALVRASDSTEDDNPEKLHDEGWFLDAEKRVLILKVLYRQHRFSTDNVRQERALSVLRQEIIHPLTGKTLPYEGLNRSTANVHLLLNDIVQGEHTGRTIYKRVEIVEDTDTEEKRLKFLYALLSKNQRRIIGYSDEFFVNIEKILNNYLIPADDERFYKVRGYHAEVLNRYTYILQARKVRMLEDLLNRNIKGKRIGYAQMLSESVELMLSLKFEIVNYFDSLVSAAIAIGESMLNDRYLVRVYISKPESRLSQKGLEIKRSYGKMVALVDDFKSIRKQRTAGNRRRDAGVVEERQAVS